MAGSDAELKLRAESASTFTIEAPRDDLYEIGSVDDTRLLLLVTRTGDLSTAAKVEWILEGGPGITANDFVGVPTRGLLDFEAGQTTATIQVDINQDQVEEADESFSIVLSGPTAGTTIGSPGEATITIRDTTIFGDNDPERLRGSDAPDYIHGFGGADLLLGLAGNDWLMPGTGADTAYGGEGNDTIRTDGGDALLFGEGGDDSISGYIGEDTIRGGDGNDDLGGSIGDDILLGEEGDDDIFGSFDDDLLKGGNGTDVLSGDQGNDRLYGEAGDDKLLGLSDEDLLSGGAGRDLLRGGHGDDTLDGGLGDDTLTGEVGNDRVTGGAGEDQLFGRTGDDSLAGGGDSDVLRGDEGVDVLHGDAGNDVLVGNAGADRLYGGTGADRFSYEALDDSPPTGAGRDTIADFSRADGDLVELVAIDADAGTAGNQAFTFIGTAGFGGHAGELRYETIGTRVIVLGDVDGDRAADFGIRMLDMTGLAGTEFLL